MKLSRGLAIAAISMIAPATALAAAPSAFASDAAPQQIPAVFQQHPDVIVAGGASVSFQVKVTNTTGNDIVCAPAFGLGDEKAAFAASQEKIQYRYDDDQGAWKDATPLDDSTGVELLGSLTAGASSDAPWVQFDSGASAVIDLRVALTKDVPAGQAVAAFVAGCFDPKNGKPSDDPSVVVGGAIHVTVAGPGGVVLPTPTIPVPTGVPSVPVPTPTKVPSGVPSTTPSKAPSSAPAVSPSHSAGATPSTQPPTVPAAIIAVATKVQPPSSTAVSAAKKYTTQQLAHTGGGDNSTALAGIGAAVVAAGAGILVLLRRRKGSASA